MNLVLSSLRSVDEDVVGTKDLEMPAPSLVRDLWPHYTANLRLYSDITDDMFACPVCLGEFSSDVLNTESECPVSAGHIFPKCIGGKEATLECRTCNNDLGSEVDASLGGEFRWQEYQDAGGERKATITTAGGRRPVSVISSKSETVIQEVAKHPLPGGRAEGELKKLFEQPWSLTFNTQHNPGKVQVALFHSAHLLLFRLFGYEYALSIGGKNVGSWLYNRALPEGVAEACRNLTDPNVLPLEPGKIGIALVDDVRCFAVCVPVYGDTIRRVVLLPGFEQDDFDAYMSVFDGTSKKLKLHVKQVGEHPPVNALADEKYKWFGHFLLERGSAD